MSVITGAPDMAWNVRGPTNSVACLVITTCTEAPSFCSPRKTSTALYAAMHPVTPSATLGPEPSVGNLEANGGSVDFMPLLLLLPFVRRRDLFEPEAWRERPARASFEPSPNLDR
jgi:hypothetical protein